MLSSLFSSVWAWVALAGGALVAVFGLYAKGQRSGVDRQKAKEAADRERNMDDIKRAAAAAAAIQPDDGGVLNDPNNRDNRRA